MENEDVTTGGDDVTIYLVKKSVTEEANREKKRRKQECGAYNGTSLGELRANSRKLRQCSKYFEACMSERWTSHTVTESSSQFEFYLVVQTEMLYYQDCFSRMNFPFPKPIPSVTYCFELLKVASQIQYQDLVDVGMKYLPAVPWTADREKQIRDFCNSGHFSSNTTSDLIARLDLPLTKEQRHKKYLDLTKRTLSRHFELALYPEPRDLETLISREYTILEFLDDRKIFALYFHSIISDSEPNMCKLQESLMTLVKEESEKILVSLKNNQYDEETEHVDGDVTRICWLYELTRRGNGSQVIAELILKHKEVKETLENAHFEVQIKWADVVHYIFEDLRNGHLFLNNLERYSLFLDWNWMFNDEIMVHTGKTNLVDFVIEIVKTFPLLEQEKIFHTWVVTQECECFLSQYYTTWLSELIVEVAKRGLKIEGEDNSTEKM